MSNACKPELGNHRPVELTVRLPTAKKNALGADALGDALRALYHRGEHCDVQLVCGDHIFLAHRVVLASQSEVFRQGLAAAPTAGEDPARQEVRLADITNPEALKFMLDFIYQVNWEDFIPETHEITKDILRLAETFQLPLLTERAASWVATDVGTDNAVERLSTCAEFSLSHLQEQILTQLALNKKALSEVAHSPQIMQHPKLLHALLQQVALADDISIPQLKKCRKAGC